MPSKKLKGAIDMLELSHGITIGITQGKISENDIIIKYKDDLGTGFWRQPKHIHWIVDWMLKREHDKKEVIKLVEYFSQLWNHYQASDCAGMLKLLHDGKLSLQSLYKHVEGKIHEFSMTLNQHGYYKVDFLIFVGFLLLLQEKNNREDAYMFEAMFSALGKDYSDLYDVITKATANYSR